MNVSTQHLTGFAVGLGTAAVGLYLYRQNQAEVDAFLRKHGIELPGCGAPAVENLTLEQLVAEKERLEDLIAEREYAAAQEAAAPATEAPPVAEAKTRKRRSPSQPSAE